ncbi:MAG: hypothetical protein IT565_06525 [Rhodospirillales bacterium]|nr:hypothetical protein [Rhodospirillales bacterium]
MVGELFEVGFLSRPAIQARVAAAKRQRDQEMVAVWARLLKGLWARLEGVFGRDWQPAAG